METPMTQENEINNAERLGIRFLKSHGYANIKDIGKRQMKRIELFLTEDNFSTFTSKGFRTILNLTEDPHINTTNLTRSQIVMEYRKNDKVLKTIAKSVIIGGNARFNSAAMGLRETDFGRNTTSFRNEFLIIYNNG